MKYDPFNPYHRAQEDEAMSWTITPSNLLVDDADALDYLTAVETADGQALESGVRLAVNAFVKGCKDDGIWPAIKASCILAGARTLAGCLVPLAGTAPTNFNFVAGDYNRKTGLVGNGSTKYLNANRNNNTDPQNNFHLAVYPTTETGFSTCLIGSGNGGGRSIIFRNSGGSLVISNRDDTFGSTAIVTSWANSLFGISRSTSTDFRLRKESSFSTITKASQTPLNSNISVFALTGLINYSSARLSFYSIGTSLDLAKLDTRVTTLMNAFAAAIS